jgi:hypothetical protein
MNNFLDSKYKLPLAIMLLAIISRLIPHAHNFAPFGAIALFGAAYFKNKKMAFVVPVIAAWVSGLILNNTIYSYLNPEFVLFDKDIPWQSLSYILTVFMGLGLLKSNISIAKVFVGAVGSSILFFIITNFGFWTTGIFYPMNVAGLMACFTAAMPFYQSTLLGDLIFSGLFFGSYVLIFNRRLKLYHVK